jgi:peptide chain release factor 3
LDPAIAREVDRRRTFAIISHPDAGKTTLTEKLLFFGGAVETAGSVKARKTGNFARSDWMKMERERGISITSTVLVFDYEGFRVNLLDTPGHQDFSEDTYRVLSAVDSAVMLIDAGRGVQAQTEKLFQVCSRRGIPIFTFMNKMDRPAREPLDLIDELEKVLGLHATAVTWPIGNGPSFEGVCDRRSRKVHLFDRVASAGRDEGLKVLDLDDPRLKELLPSELYERLLQDLELLDGAMPPLDLAQVRAGELTPVFFGSAMTNFGVQLFLESLIEYAPPPGALGVAEGRVDPRDPRFSGFIFKIQANMNRAHRDRVAFMRVCSGKFERGMVVKHPRLGRTVRLSHPSSLFGQERVTLDEAYAGDVVGLVNPDLFIIGDTVHVGDPVRFEDIPRFSPEYFASVRPSSPAKQKGFRKGIDALAAEGVVQILLPRLGPRDLILAAVGPLQFEVVVERMLDEYATPIVLEKLPYVAARWADRKDLPALELHNVKLVDDALENLVALFPTEWELRYFEKQNPGVKLLFTSPRPLGRA